LLFYRAGAPRSLHSFPTRRSSDLVLLRPVYVPLLGGFQVDEAEVTARAEAQLKALADALGGEAAVHVRVGHPALTIVDFAEAERSEEHTSELQSRENLVCRLLLEK